MMMVKKPISEQLQEMEDSFASSIQQPAILRQDNNYPAQNEFLDLTKDIRWSANETGCFENEDITEYYANNSYGKITRWDLFGKAVEAVKQHNIHTLIDIGAANNHFVYLAKKSGIDAYGIEPRKEVLTSASKVFAESFGHEQKFGFVGNIKTFSDCVLSPECDLEVDCISVMNFLHGPSHDPTEIKNLFLAFEKCAKYVLITEPAWSTLGIERTVEKYKLTAEVYRPGNGVAPHFLFQITK